MSDLLYFDPGRRKARPKPLLRTVLGDMLRRLRFEQGRTLADVARAAKVSMPYLSEVERGRKEASSEVLAAICAALGVEVWDLLTEIGRDQSSARIASGPSQPAQPPNPELPVLPTPMGPTTPPATTGPSDAVCLLAA
jgi:predicted transcriptional regulator